MQSSRRGDGTFNGNWHGSMVIQKLLDEGKDEVYFDTLSISLCFHGYALGISIRSWTSQRSMELLFVHLDRWKTSGRFLSLATSATWDSLALNIPYVITERLFSSRRNGWIRLWQTRTGTRWRVRPMTLFCQPGILIIAQFLSLIGSSMLKLQVRMLFFKFEASWMVNNAWSGVVAEAWRGGESAGDPLNILHSKLDLYRRLLVWWSKQQGRRKRVAWVKKKTY